MVASDQSQDVHGGSRRSFLAVSINWFTDTEERIRSVATCYKVFLHPVMPL